MAAEAHCKSSTACSAPPTDVRSQSRCSTATPPIRKPWRHRSSEAKQRFHLDRVVLVGDRGMITEARITEDLKAAGLDWITALRAPAIKELLNSGALQLTLFDLPISLPSPRRTFPANG